MKIDRIELADLGESVKIAEEIHRQIGDIPLPIPVQEIGTAVGISEIHEMKTDSFEGGLITNVEKSDGIILVNVRSNRHRRRFTIGHELGHFLNPWHQPEQGTQFRCTAADMQLTKSSKTDRSARMEVEANEFSAEVLMPRARFRRDIRRHVGADLDYILELATSYDVSKEAAARRYVDFHDEPCAVIFSKDRCVRYPYKNRAFPRLDVWSKLPLPQQSLSARFDGSVGRPSEWGEVDAGLWLSKSRNTLLYEQTLRQQNGFQITLLTIESDQEAKEEEALVESWTPKFRR